MSVNYITDEIRAMIGVKHGPIMALQLVNQSEVRRFHHAIMDQSPRYWNEEWAKTSRYGGLVAPPAFPQFAFRRGADEPDPLDRFKDDPGFDGLSRDYRGLPALKVPLPRLLNGGYDYEFYRYARVGERVYRTSTYLDVYQREGKSGPMVFIVAEALFTVDGGVPLVRATTTTILR